MSVYVNDEAVHTYLMDSFFVFKINVAKKIKYFTFKRSRKISTDTHLHKLLFSIYKDRDNI